MVTLFVLYINSKEEIEVFVIAAMAIILFLTGMKNSCKRGYIILDRIDIQCEIVPVPEENSDRFANRLITHRTHVKILQNYCTY